MFASKKHQKKINLKKMLLIGLVGLGAVVLLSVLAFYIWLGGWKTYNFPDGLGSIKYPPNWFVGRDIPDTSNSPARQVIPGGYEYWQFDKIRDANVFGKGSDNKYSTELWIFRRKEVNSTLEKDVMGYIEGNFHDYQNLSAYVNLPKLSPAPIKSQYISSGKATIYYPDYPFPTIRGISDTGVQRFYILYHDYIYEILPTLRHQQLTPIDWLWKYLLINLSIRSISFK